MKYIAFDIGDKRIGIAVSDPFGEMALPLETYYRKNFKKDIEYLVKIAKDRYADVIVCVFKKLENYMPQVMLRAGAFSNGVPMALCSKNYACLADIRGKILLASNSEIVKININVEKDYHLISSRRRGLYKDFNSGY